MALGKRSSKGPLQKALGQGANINEANPLQVAQDIREMLRDVFGAGTNIDLNASDDAFQSIQIEHRLDRRLKDFFNARHDVAGVTSRLDDIESVWDANGLRPPSDWQHTAIFSRKAFMYPSLTAWAILPTLDPALTNFGFGFEDGGRAPGGAACFSGSGNLLRAETLARSIGGHLVLTPFLPADYDTAYHRYGVKINRCNVEYTIDGALVAIVLFGLQSLTIPTIGNTLPYCLRGIATDLCVQMTSYLEVPYSNPNSWIGIPANDNYFVASDDDPLPPRCYKLYTEETSTEWNGLATAGNVVTSHPIPVWGYPNKTLVFQADAAGSLDIQVYVGGDWRSWVPGGITLVANQLEVYNLNGEIAVARCVYTPTNNDTITLAECYLS